MTRINTNVISLTAQTTLAKSNNMLQDTLTRLSTGLRINSGKDDPAGMIAANALGNDIKASQQAIANSQVANQMISTADSALGQISSLLTDIRGLVTQAANNAAMSSSQVAANQLQIDSSLDAINRISQTTNFQGKKLLDGSLDFIVAKDTGYTKVTNLQVSQANFGTASQVAVDIKVSAVARQAQIGATVNDGAVGNAKATSTLTFADASSISLQAPGTGAGANGIRVTFVESSTIGAGNASASFNSTNQTMTITVADTGTTTAQTIADAITNDTDFTVTANSTGNVGYVAGSDSDATSSTTVTTANAGTMVITSLIPGTGMDGKTVTFTAGNATGGPTVTVDSSNNLTVVINDKDHAGGVTTLADIAQAINAYTDSHGRNVFSANVTNGGSFQTAVDSTTRLALDGFGAATPKTDSTTTIVLDGTNDFDVVALGASANGARVVVNQVTSGTGTVVWDSTANGGNGQLTINLSTVGGGGSDGVYDAADIQDLFDNHYTTAVGSDPTPFAAADIVTTGMSVGGFDANDLTGVAQITAVSAGSDGWQHNSSAAALAGAGVGGVFAGGTGTSGLAADLVIQVGGNSGSQLLSFGSGTTAAQMVTALNLVSDSTGVTASVEGDELQFKSAEYGKASFVSVKVVSEGTGGTFGSSLSATYAMGTDIAATVNNIAATGSGNTISFSSSSLSFSASLDPAQIAVGDEVKFNLNGGGALFQLGPQVASSQQARLGIQSVDTGTLGGTVGRLYQLASGKDASLATSTQLAGKIILAAIDGVSSLRGQLGAFQKSTVDTNIASLTDAVTNLTAAQSSIQDADFATESANLTRAQILVQSGTAVLGIANKNPENVLALLR